MDSSRAGATCCGGRLAPCKCFGLIGGFSFGMGGFVGVTGGTAASPVALKLRRRSGFGAGDRGTAELDWSGPLFMLSKRASRDETGFCKPLADLYLVLSSEHSRWTSHLSCRREIPW